MAHTVTVADVITRIREMADMENTQFITDAEILRRVNQSYRRLYNEIAATCEDYFTISTTIPTVANQADYDLPADFYKLRGIDYEDANRPVSLRRFEFRQRNIKVWPGQQPAAYTLVNDHFTVYPTPSGIHNLTFHYIPVPADLTSVGSFNAYNGWDQYVTEQVAIQCLEKEESDTSGLRADFERTRRDITSYFTPRDEANARMMRDVFEERADEFVNRWPV